MNILKKIINSFRHSFIGFIWSFKKELNIKIAILLLCSTITLNIIFNVSYSRWMITILSIILLLCLELMNTAIEKFIDFFIKEYHYDIKIIKDMSASAVLIALVAYIIISFITYYNYIF
jgi:diacylglycerol kinase (ATP)